MSATREALSARREYSELEATFAALAQDLLAEIGKTDPAEKDKRDNLYFQFRALKDVEQRLVAKAAGVALEEHRQSLAEAGFSR